MLQSITVCIINMYNYNGKFHKLMRLETTLLFNISQMENLGESQEAQCLSYTVSNQYPPCEELYFHCGTSVPKGELKDRNYQIILNPWWTILIPSKCVFKFH